VSNMDLWSFDDMPMAGDIYWGIQIPAIVCT
jgi:hypothetical protein